MAGARLKDVKVKPKLLVARVEVVKVAFTQVWHKLHVILWFGACAGGIR